MQKRGLMKDLSVLQESPFTDKCSVVEVFTDLTVWMGIRKVIEQVNANVVIVFIVAVIIFFADVCNTICLVPIKQ